MSARRRIAVVGAAGLVGQEVLSLLDARHEEIGSLRAYATERSAGDKVTWGGSTVRIERLPALLPAVDVVFLCASPEVSEELTEDLVDEGALVIDTSGVLADRTDVALAGPGVTVERAEGGQVVSVADPRSTVVAAVAQALDPVIDVRRVLATFLVPASFSGRDSTERMVKEAIALLGGREPECEDGDGDGSAFNVRPSTPAGDERVRHEVARLFPRELPFELRTLRSPGVHGLGAMIWVEGSRGADREVLERALRESPSLLLGEEPDGTRDVAGSDAIHVGSPVSTGSWVSLWVAADNLRQGAALGAVAAFEGLSRSRS